MTAEKTKAHNRLLKFINAMALRPIAKARAVHCCALCEFPIEIGTQYRDGGSGRRAHQICLHATMEVICRDRS